MSTAINSTAINSTAINTTTFIQPGNATTNQYKDTLLKARDNGYDDTIFIAQYLLNQCNNSKYEDDKNKIAEQLFELINKNPNILIFEPKFRNILQEKANEFEHHLTSRTNTYKKVQYHEVLKTLMLSMRKNIRNSIMRDKIYKNITDIGKILTDYEEWVIGTPLKTQITIFTNTLQNIKTHPQYIKN